MEGADFQIKSRMLANYIDVSVNLTPEGLNTKCVEGTYPTLFIPWVTGTHEKKSFERNYAYDYLCTGEIDMRRFLRSVVSVNREIGGEIRKYLEIGKTKNRSWVLGDKEIDLQDVWYNYYNHLDAAINLLSSAIGMNSNTQTPHKMYTVRMPTVG